MHECNKEREIDLMHEDIREIKSDVKSLLELRWKMHGIKIAIIGTVSGIVSFIIAIISK